MLLSSWYSLLYSEMSYTLNEDGTVTRQVAKKQPDSSNDNSGCWIFFVIAVVVGVIAFAISSNNRSSSVEAAAEEVEEAVEEVIEEIPEEVAEETTYNYATYLTVSDDDVYFDAEGGYKDIEINTDGDWEVSIGTASWGSLTRRGNTLRLQVEENTEASDRDDYFVVKAGDYEKRIDIIQSADNTPTAEIKNIWIDHNDTDPYENRGMKIHIEFDISGMLNRTGQAAAYFYYSNGTPLRDTNGQYRTSNGNVATHVDFVPNYKDCTFKDLVIFMPYSELHLSQSASCYLTISLWCSNTEVAQSEKYYFDITF